jgi:hypothetical protein
MASSLNLFWATSSAGSGCYSYTRNNKKYQQTEHAKELRPKHRLPRRQRSLDGIGHLNTIAYAALNSKYNRIFPRNCQRLVDGTVIVQVLAVLTRWHVCILRVAHRTIIGQCRQGLVSGCSHQAKTNQVACYQCESLVRSLLAPSRAFSAGEIPEARSSNIRNERRNMPLEESLNAWLY